MDESKERKDSLFKDNSVFNIVNSHKNEQDNNKKNEQYKLFLDYINNSADKFKKKFIKGRETNIKIISHLDADGISAASIIIKMLSRLNINFSLSIVPEINSSILKGLVTDMFDIYILSDLGSGYLKEVYENLIINNKKVVILDHHELSKNDTEIREEYDNSLIEINPHMFNIDGSTEISGSGVSYLFAKAVDKRNMDIAHIAVVGAMGDYQISDNNSELNNLIIDDAKKEGNLKVIKGLKLFGAQTRPLIKVLNYCTDPYLPGITGSENGAIQFLLDLGINPKIGNKWKKLVNLTKSELEKLVEGLIMMRINSGHTSSNDLIGNVYILPNEEKESPLRDVKEFATLLNACGRLNKASYGIGACLNEEKLKVRAINTMADYKRKIMNSIKWYNENKNNKKYVIKTNKYTIINAMDNIYYTLIGTFASILSHSTELPTNYIIIAMAQQYDLQTKISARISSKENNSIDLKKLLDSIISIVGGQSGGHKDAAGAIIATESEQKFIETAKGILDKISIEEKVKI